MLEGKPIIICGAHGGGTSFTTKMLRSAGLYVGDDVEPFEARKFHESSSFRAANIFIFRQLGGDVNGMSESFMKTYYQNFNNPALIKNIKDNIEKNLNLILNKFSANDQKVFTKPWGWKDPRNSPNLYFWLNVFPEAKILMIEKKESHKRSKSPSGNWFRQATEYQKQFYYNPASGINLSLMQEDKILKVSFEELTSKQICLDKVTNFCGIEKVNLQTTLRLCNYEK